MIRLHFAVFILLWCGGLNCLSGRLIPKAGDDSESHCSMSGEGGGCSQTMAGAGAARCNFVAGQPLYNPNFNPKDPNSPYLNRAAFVQPANFTYGNVPAVITQLYQPTQLGEDVAASKSFNFGRSEKNSVEFRASAFNVANRHLLGGLNTNITNSSFGTFSNPQSNLPRNLQFSLRVSF